MKKYMWMFLLFCLFGLSFAQDNGASSVSKDNYIDTPGEIKNITQTLASDNGVEIQQIQFRFCNDNKLTKDLELNMRPWQKKQICIAINNQSPKQIPLRFWFSEWIINSTNDLVCGSDKTENKFSRQIAIHQTTGIMLPASGNLIEMFTYIAPKNVSWNTIGCFGYEIDRQEAIKDGNMFLIIPRKVWYIHINITWSVYNFWWLDDIKDTYTKNKNIIFTIIAVILGIWILITIFQKDTKKDKHISKK